VLTTSKVLFFSFERSIFIAVLNNESVNRNNTSARGKSYAHRNDNCLVWCNFKEIHSHFRNVLCVLITQTRHRMHSRSITLQPNRPMRRAIFGKLARTFTPHLIRPMMQVLTLTDLRGGQFFWKVHTLTEPWGRRVITRSRCSVQVQCGPMCSDAVISTAVTVLIFPFPVQFWSVFGKTVVSVFHGFGFSIQKMFIALHITFVENDQTYYFASNYTPVGQHCYVRL